ncbi:carbon starvation CstA family protein, partial [Escherichia coli]|uniref:carbon starvation CstA family protein n=1 Tax=Escherichia coli TaxID=562 RepID=UPI0035DB57FA
PPPPPTPPAAFARCTRLGRSYVWRGLIVSCSPTGWDLVGLGSWLYLCFLSETSVCLPGLDAGTRYGRVMQQDLLGNFIPFLKKTDSLVAGIIGTAGCVGLWGYL